MAKALKMASVGPVMVTMRSGQFPSEMLMRAPLWKREETASGYRSPGTRCRRVHLHLHAFSSRFLLSGRDEDSENGTRTTAEPSCYPTFPMMLPTSCRNRKHT